MELYFAPQITNQQYVLPEQESYHCVKVLRHIEGDTIHIIDGTGGLYKAEITSAHKTHCGFKIISGQKEYGKKNFRLHIAIAPTKNIERIEWLLEKATEIGIDEITPLVCQHSERRKVNHERLEGILVSAIKQSIKAYLPKLNELTDFDNFLKTQDNIQAQKFICHLDEKHNTHLKTVYKPGNNAIILIGPEGDFTNEEIESAIKQNFQPVILGNSRLRTETAALVACHTINLINEG
jgi:16S rRNA (uracil1498-N3)-methyltransferase